jgi:hypothetical protein
MFTGKFSIFFLAFFLSWIACKNDSPKAPPFDKALLHGRWEIAEAWRNAKPTETLVGTFYEFGNNGKMKTNLTETMMEEEFEYDLKNNVISQASKPEETLYQIEALSDSSLTLSTSIRNIPFRLRFFKTLPPTDSIGIIQ